MLSMLTFSFLFKFQLVWTSDGEESEVTQSCLTLWPHGLYSVRLLHPWDFSGKNTGVGCHFLLQRIFPIWGLNPGLPHCRQTLYHLSHQGSLTGENWGPRIFWGIWGEDNDIYISQWCLLMDKEPFSPKRNAWELAGTKILGVKGDKCHWRWCRRR